MKKMIVWGDMEENIMIYRVSEGMDMIFMEK